MFFEGLQIAESAVFVNEGILIPLCPRFLTHDTHFRNIFHIDLDSLTRVLHLFVRFRDILRIRKLHRKLIPFAQESIQTGDGSGVATLTQLYPEHDQTGVFVSSEHIQDEFDFLLRMLIGMAVRAMRAIC